MKPQLTPYDINFWYLKTPLIKQLTSNCSYDVVVIGGGMAGLSAAQGFFQKGIKVALIEKALCGSGATGKSSGFITPDSEISLHAFIARFGQEKAQKIWDLGTHGVSLIKNNIQSYNLDCDYIAQDTLIVANTQKSFLNDIQKEHQARKLMNFDSTLYRNSSELSNILRHQGYQGGIRYGETFSINGYKYCQALKSQLQKEGLDIFEETPAIEIKDHSVITPKGKIKANLIIFCVDRFLADFNILDSEIYPLQNFIILSAPLTLKQIDNLFPQDPCMVWDTDLLYTYYRITHDNRFLIGGSNLYSIYAGYEQYSNKRIIEQLASYAQKKFPFLDLTFEYTWPGLIATTKDIFPIAGVDKDKDYIYYITGTSGLPWASAVGNYSSEKFINNNTSYDEIFSPYRAYSIGPIVQKILGKKLSFALSSYITLT